ncbi:MAG: DUF364 domain-containing protein [Termitinemataceae bacterium]
MKHETLSTRQTTSGNHSSSSTATWQLATRGRSPSALYEELIEGIPSTIRVEEAIKGSSHSLVIAEDGIGTVMHLGQGTLPAMLPDPDRLAGRLLKDVAAGVLSWNLEDAALGGAALNAYYNAPSVLEHNFGSPLPDFDPFLQYAPRARGKKVAGIGHFGALDRYIAPEARAVYIIEQQPRQGDYPREAAEFLLPEMDLVFITGSALANKSLPRLLELAQGAFIVLVGPSTCLAPVLFSYGVSALCGTLYTDKDSCRSIVLEGSHKKMIQHGKKVALTGCRKSCTEAHSRRFS